MIQSVAGDVRRAAIGIVSLVLLGVCAVATAQPPSNPGSAQILERKGCLSCHRFAGKGGKGSDLAFASGGEWTPSGFLSSLWNHGPNMWASAEKNKSPLPTLSTAEVEELLATLSAKRPFAKDPPGKPEEGKRVFRVHDCTACHGEVDSPAGGKLAPVGRVRNLAELASALWTSLPAMMEMEGGSKKWEHIDASEMRHMLAYLEKPAPSGGKPSGR